MNSDPLIVRGLCKSYGRRRILDALDWTIERGQVVGLLGRNGAGKSTLLDSILGLRSIDSGSVHVFGEAVGTFSDATRARLGYVPQNVNVFELLKAEQMLEYFRAFYTHWDHQRVAALLKRWDIPTDVTIGKMSGGEQRRLAIIRALGHDPELLLLDEPAAALDPAGRREFLREIVDQVTQRGTTVVFSTHILTDLERVALDVAFLKDGKIALSAPLDRLLEQARRVTGDRSIVAALPRFREVSRSMTGDQVSVVGLMEEEAMAFPETLQVDPVSLEDLFVEVTR